MRQTSDAHHRLMPRTRALLAVLQSAPRDRGIESQPQAAILSIKVYSAVHLSGVG